MQPANTIQLMHGTSHDRYRKIVESGRMVGPVYLSDCADVADYYAKERAKKDGSSPCVLTISVDASKLIVDIDSFVDIIPPTYFKHGLQESGAMDSWWKMIGTLDFYSKSGVSGKDSLKIVNAAIHKDSITVSEICSLQSNH